MSKDPLTDETEFMLRYAGINFDLFLYTQIGTLKRISLPAGLLAFTVFFCGYNEKLGETVLQGELDRWTLKVAASQGGTYSESLTDVLHRFWETDVYKGEFNRIGLDPAERQRIIDIHDVKQAELERKWREANNDWREHLPYVFD